MPSETSTQFFSPNCDVPTGVENVIALVAPFNADQFHPDLFEFYGIIEPATIQKAVPKRRAGFLAGRVLAAQAFSDLKLPRIQVPIGKNRAPQWPNGVAGSISHTDDHCATIIALRNGVTVGIDIEAILLPKSMPAVLKRVVTDNEKAWIAKNLSSPNDVFYTTLFSAKETIFKALYPITQTYFGFEAAEICAQPSDNIMQLRLTEELHQTLPKGLVLNVNVQPLENNILTWMVFDRP